MSSLGGLQARNDSFVARLDRHWRLLLAILIVVSVSVLVVQARGKALWHDEIYTILGARLSPVTLWRASLDGMDLSPPLNTIATRLVRAVAGEGPIASRLPPLAGFITAIAVVFLVVRRKSNVVAAVAAALMLCLTPAWKYAIEARGYGLAVGLFALALYGWTEAARGHRVTRHLTLMGVCLAAGVWTHYYFVLAFVPIVAAEATRQFLARRLQSGPWAALILAIAATLPLASLARASGSQRATFWLRQTSGMADTYAFLVDGLRPYSIAFALLLGLIAIELVRRLATRQWPRRMAAADVVLCLVCLMVPAGGVILGGFTHVFMEKYVLFAAAGLAVAVPLLAWSMLPPEGFGDWAGAAIVAVLFGLLASRAIADRHPLTNPLASRPALADMLKGSFPFAMTGGVAYLEMWYYASEETRARAVYLADPLGQRRDTGSDTADRNYLALARWSPVPAVPVSEFVKTHKRFWLYAFDSNWAEKTLRDWGATLTMWGKDSPAAGILYEVRMPE